MPELSVKKLVELGKYSMLTSRCGRRCGCRSSASGSSDAGCTVTSTGSTAGKGVVSCTGLFVMTLAPRDLYCCCGP